MRQLRCVFFLTFLFPLIAFSQASGALDGSFNGTGIITGTFTPFSNIGFDVIVRPNGKIVALVFATGSRLVSYNSNGTPDMSFGVNGVSTTTYGSVMQSVAMREQSDGKIVTTGFYNTSAHDGVITTRYLNNGSLDLTFGTNGIATTSLNSISNRGQDLAVQNDGKVLVTGRTCSPWCSIFVLRYDTNGVFDPSFGNSGVITYSLGSQHTVMPSSNALAVQTDGKIVLAMSEFDGTNSKFVLTRLNSDGSTDNSFGVNGYTSFAGFTSGTEHPRDLLIQPDGKILVAGASNLGFVCLRYNSNGSLDSFFGLNGISQSDPLGDPYKIALQQDNKILLAGNYNSGYGIIRYDTNGVVDASFGNGGIASVTINANYDYINSMALQPDGKIVLSGFTSIDQLYLIARHHSGFVTSISEPSVDNEIIIYPNPTTDKVHIVSPFNEFIESITLYNISGSVLLEKKGNDHIFNLNFLEKNISVGLYILKIKTNNLVYTRKLVLK